MCYGAEAIPPDHGRRGEIAREEDLVLTSADGTRFAAHLALAGEPGGTGMVILPDVRGLHNFYCALARRFAVAGIDALAIDYFGRTSPDVAGRPADFDWQSEIAKVKFDDVAIDAKAAASHLTAVEPGRIDRLFTVGFCFGGAMSWRQSAMEGLSGAIGFYGRPERVRDALPNMKAPLLLLLAGNDFATPPDEFELFDRELTDAGVPHRKVVYDGAPHSFFDVMYEEWKDACSDAWRQIFAFIDHPETTILPPAGSSGVLPPPAGGGPVGG